MCHSLQVRWTVIPATTPQPWIACSRCGGLRAHRCSGKIRLNANGRRLDAWLNYKCTSCEGTWNRTIFERRNIREIDPATLAALQSNDPDWIRAQAFDLGSLGRSARRIDVSAECELRKELVHEASGWTCLQIELSIPFPVGLRLDRLLAAGLQLSRSRLGAWRDAGLLTVSPGRADPWRRPVRDGTQVAADLSDVADRHLTWWSRAVGENVTATGIGEEAEPESRNSHSTD